MPLAPPIDAIQQPSVGIYGLPVGASAGAMVLLTAAQIRAHADLSGYVPYTGATGAVNLGANALTCGAITASGGVTSVANDFYVSDSGTYYFSNVTRNRGMLISSGGGGRIGFKAGGTEWLQISDAGAITASGTIITRNGTSPTSIQITNTYTSSTSFGLLDIRANAAQTAYEISSFLGSAGGANLPINIGHRNSAGTFTSALSVATSGAITASGPVGIFTDTPSRRLHVVGPAVGTASARFTGPTIDNNWGGHIEFTANNGTLYGGVVASVTGMYLSTGSTTKLSLESAGATFAGAITASGTILTRNGTSPTSIQITNTYTSATSFGLLDIRANAAQTAYEISSFLGSAGGANLPINIGHRNSAGTFTSALSVATSGAITASGQIIQTPPASVTLATNGQFSIEMTSDTAGNLVYRGSDGTTRRAALVFA